MKIFKIKRKFFYLEDQFIYECTEKFYFRYDVNYIERSILNTDDNQNDYHSEDFLCYFEFGDGCEFINNENKSTNEDPKELYLRLKSLYKESTNDEVDFEKYIRSYIRDRRIKSILS